MIRIIVASQSEKLILEIRTGISLAGYEIISTVNNGYELIRKIKIFQPDIVIIDEDLQGISIFNLVGNLLNEKQAVILIGKLHKKFYFEEKPYFEFCEKPIQPIALITMIKVLYKYSKSFKQLELKVKKLENEKKAEKIIKLAKIYLQKYENMSEDEAHHYIQKYSMEKRISKLELSKKIIKKFKKYIDFNF